MTESTPWYHEGLRFQCTQCGNCCTGGPGVVWTSDEEQRQIAEFLQISIGEMQIHHTRLVADRRSLREFPNGDCVFLDGRTRQCKIYPVRPAQCRTWPFWNSNLESPVNWVRAQSICPGMGQGDFIPLETIQQQAAVIDI